MQAGGLFVLFGLLFACGLGLPLPEDIPLTVAGFCVAKGYFHLAFAAIVAWCGIIGGDLMLYHFGKRYGLNVTKVPFVGKHVTEGASGRPKYFLISTAFWSSASGGYSRASAAQWSSRPAQLATASSNS